MNRLIEVLVVAAVIILFVTIIIFGYDVVTGPPVLR